MRHNYAGDQGDLTKYALLRAMQNAGLTVGVNWYLSVHDEPNGDGHLRSHLDHPDDWAALDEPLVKEMARVFKGLPPSRCNVALLEQEAFLPAAVYFSAALPTGAVTVAQRERARVEWHRQALVAMAGVDLVCLDPDNGLEVKSRGPRSKWRCKYANYAEVNDYLAAGKSVVPYQHARRMKWPALFAQVTAEMRAAGVQMLNPGFIAVGDRGFFLLDRDAERLAKMRDVALALQERMADWKKLRITVIPPRG